MQIPSICSVKHGVGKGDRKLDLLFPLLSHSNHESTCDISHIKGYAIMHPRWKDKLMKSIVNLKEMC